MIIDEREINSHNPPYVVAEISCNHNGNLERAMKLIAAAKKAGADAVKFQAYEAQDMTINHHSGEFLINGGPWSGHYVYDLYNTAKTPLEWFPALFSYARAINLTPFASVFSRRAVDLLESLHCPAYKIASMEITDIPLIEYAVQTGKPIIISTGMANSNEIYDAACVTKPWSSAFLACTSAYPTPIANSGLWRVRWLKDVWDVRATGISDHTQGWTVPVAAIAMGAQIIEKHLMLGDEDTEDYAFSLDPTQFKIMTDQVKAVWHSIHSVQMEVENSSRQLRRSLYIIEDIKAGEPFTDQNVRSIRPSHGLAPKELPWVLTTKAASDLKRGTALRKDHCTAP